MAMGEQMRRWAVRLRGVAVFAVVAWAPAHAGLLNVAWDNDLLTGSDKGYTNGLRLSWLSTAAEQNDECKTCVVAGLRDGFSWLPGVGSPGSRHAVAVSLRQMMVTPENIEAAAPQYDDIPYMGYLSVESFLYSWNHTRMTGYGITAGIIGPDSGAERAQKWVHKISGSTDPQGWDNQLGTDIVGGLHVTHAHRFLVLGEKQAIRNEFVWGASAQASTFLSNAMLGIFWRAGRNLPGNFVPEYAGLSSSIGLPGLLDTTGKGWSVFAGLIGEAIPYSYLEERSGPYTFEQRTLVGHVSLGAGLHTDNFQVALTLRATTAQEETNKDPLTFGTLSLTWRL